jgi:hypothetical protein
MKEWIAGFFTIMALTATAQYKDSCSYVVTLKYPEKAIENNISGEVIVELDQDKNGILSNPVVIKGIGYGCDEEALRVVKMKISGINKCEIRYRPPVKGKTKMVVNFLPTLE